MDSFVAPARLRKKPEIFMLFMSFDKAVIIDMPSMITIEPRYIGRRPYLIAKGINITQPTAVPACAMAVLLINSV